MSHLRNFFTAAVFKIIFILLIFLALTVLPASFFNQIDYGFFLIIFFLANGMAYASFRINGSYIISGITNCLIGSIIYALDLFAMNLGAFIQIEILASFLYDCLIIGSVLSLVTGLIGALLLFRRKKRRRNQQENEFRSDELIN